MIELISAMTKNSCIGKDNKLPWGRLKGDMRFFKKTTIGKAVIMGRKTFESLGGEPLPHRINIVVSRTLGDEYDSRYVTVVDDIEEALEEAHKHEKTPIIIGGGTIYEQAIELVDVMYITMVDTEVDGDTYFPYIGFRDWRREIISSGVPDEDNDYGYTIHKFTRP